MSTISPPSTGWTWIDNVVVERIADIGIAAFAVYVAMARHADANRQCHPGRERIADMLGISVATVKRSIKVLADAGLVTVQRVSNGRGKGVFNVYTLTLHRVTHDPMKDTSGQKQQLHRVKNESYIGSPMTRKQDPVEQDPKNKSSCSEQSSEQQQVEVFEFLLKGGHTWMLSAAKFQEYVAAYPKVDVSEECRKARQWCIDNPPKRKTASGMPRFLNNWFSNSNNGGSHNGNGRQRSTLAPGPGQVHPDDRGSNEL